MIMDPAIEEYVKTLYMGSTWEPKDPTTTTTTTSTTSKKPSRVIDEIYDAIIPGSDYSDYDWGSENDQIGQWIESIFKKQPQPPTQTLMPAHPPAHPVPLSKHRHHAPETTAYGTRHFLPALVSLVALVCFGMILISVCRVIFSRKKRKNTVRTVEEGSKLETFEPSAPPPDETSVQITHLPDSTSNHDDTPPPNYESLFGSSVSAAPAGPVDGRPSTNINDRYPSERMANESEDSTPSQPLLSSTQPQTGSDSCSGSSTSRHTQL